MFSDDILLDMHVHSRYSKDSILSLIEIHKTAMKAGVTPIICDHNSIRGSKDYINKGYYHDNRIPPVYSEEIKTSNGEIIGLFLNENISPNQSPEETLDLIAEQDGVAIIPHPGDRFRKSAMKYETISSLLPRIHAIEVYNSRTLSLMDINKAKEFAIKYYLPITGGSDAHSQWELFKTTIKIAPFDSPKEFLKNLDTAEIRFRRSIPIVHMLSVLTRKVRR